MIILYLNRVILSGIKIAAVNRSLVLIKSIEKVSNNLVENIKYRNMFSKIKFIKIHP